MSTPRTPLTVGLILASLALAPGSAGATPNITDGRAVGSEDRNTCESLAAPVVNAWNQSIRPEIDAYAQSIGMLAQKVRSGRDAVSVSGAVSRAAIGVDHNQLADQLMDEAIAEILQGVSSTWSQIGPQALDIPARTSGRITPVVGTTRMFITPPNLTHRRTRITVTKLDGRQRAEIVICKAPYDDPGNYTRVRVFEFDNGLANAGESQTVTINDSFGFYFTVKVRKFVGTNAFEYRVQTETAGQRVTN
jgi:hypothetical protein